MEVTMEVFSGRSASTLNPYAAPFVPGTAYRAAREISPEWWRAAAAATSSLRDSTAASQADAPGAGDYLDRVLPDADSLFHSYTPDYQEAEEPRPGEMMAWGPRSRLEGSWYFQEAARIVNARMSQ